MTTGDTGASPLPTASSEPSTQPTDVRRLTRSRDDRWIAGVAGGLADYLGVDSLLVRVAMMLLALLSGGAVLIVYILAAFIIPDDRADTTGRRRGGSAVAGVTFGLVLVGVGTV
ncbi:MAG: PspC domain-containing protein [Dehalococcoidia bacterium]|nr:PspC domain-containing protein [Dehalococcoidia bacterium]